MTIRSDGERAARGAAIATPLERTAPPPIRSSGLARKLLVGLGSAVVIWLSTIAFVVEGFRRIEERVSEITAVVQPLAAAAAALELSTVGTSTAVLRFLADPTAANRAAVDRAIADTERERMALVAIGGSEISGFDRIFADRYQGLAQTGRYLVGLRGREAAIVAANARSLANFGRLLDEEVPTVGGTPAERAALQGRMVGLRAELVHIVGRLSGQVSALGQSGDDPAARALLSARRMLAEAALQGAPAPLAAWLRAVGDEMGRLAALNAEAVEVRAALRHAMEGFEVRRSDLATLVSDQLQAVIGQRLATVDAEAHRTIVNGRTAAVAFALLTVAASIAVLVLANRLVIGPLLALAAGANRVGSGDFSVTVPAVAGRTDEIGRLIAAFNAMMVSVGTAQRGLSEHAQELDDAVRERTSELERANRALRDAVAEAQRANAAKSAFLAAMSRELRTPLNAIIGFSEVIAADLFGPGGAARYREYAGDITRSGQHLLAIVNDLLDMVKIEAGKLELFPETIDVAAAVDEVVLMLRGRIADARLTCALDLAPDAARVEADPRIVKQMLLNLLSNAMKFTRPGGRIVVAARRDAGMIALSVADTGIGMAPEEIARATEPFYQADDSLARKYEGTGLGLTLVRAFAERHGGRLAIASAPGSGTTVTIFLPLDAVNADGAPLASAAD